MSETLKQLEATLAERRNAAPEDSYVASLHHKGLNKILEKVGEECTEALLAAKDLQAQLEAHKDALPGKSELVYETADLWFHTMVMLSHLNISHEEVLDELKRRFNLSGLVEKAQRSQES